MTSSFRNDGFQSSFSSDHDQQYLQSNANFPGHKNGHHTSPVSVTSNKYLEQMYSPRNDLHFDQFRDNQDMQHYYENSNSYYHNYSGNSVPGVYKMASNSAFIPRQEYFQSSSQFRQSPPRQSAAGGPYSQPTERQNLIHSASLMVGNDRFQLPHPPVVNEETVVFMVRTNLQLHLVSAHSDCFNFPTVGSI
jgi:hypothetical protein